MWQNEAMSDLNAMYIHRKCFDRIILADMFMQIYEQCVSARIKRLRRSFQRGDHFCLDMLKSTWMERAKFK